MVQQDVAFHGFLYTASGNPLLASTAAPHWRYLRRVMSDVLRRAEPPEAIWRQHADILTAVVAGDPATAQARAEAHVAGASERLAAALEAPKNDQGERHDHAGRADARRSPRRTGASRSD
jgi:DNA-binding FadR family transcriptional regulator